MTRQCLTVVLFFLLLYPGTGSATVSGQDMFRQDAFPTQEKRAKNPSWTGLPQEVASKIQGNLRKEIRSFERAENGTVSGSTEDGSLKLDADLRVTRFASGNDWFALTLESVGRADAMRKIAAPALKSAGAKLELVREGLTEWYVNHGAALEHGLTLYEKPEGAGQLRFSFATTGNLVPRQSKEDIHFVGNKTIHYSGIKAWDASGRILSCALSVEQANVIWTVDDSLAQYPITVDPIVTVAKTLEGATFSSSFFGYSVSLDGDSILVGADAEISDTGAAYLFSRNKDGADQWGLVKKFEAPESGGRFGGDVSLKGDLAIVGASYENGRAGAVYIYSKDQGGAGQWGLVKKLSGTTSYDYFGVSVAIDGDYAVVGASGGSNYTGAVYIYYKDEGGSNQWGLVKRHEGPTERYYFGASVFLSGDLVIVGANGANGGVGAAYIYSKDTGGEGQWGELKAFDSPAAGGKFGSGVALDGDLALIGASRENNDTGAAYLFSRNEGGPDQWGQVKRLEGGVEGSRFGTKVSLSGDVAVIGAWAENSYAGAAYIYSKDQDGEDQWGLVSKQEGTEASREFGQDVSVSGYYAAVGAPRQQSYAGMTYIYDVVLAAPVAADTAAGTSSTSLAIDLSGSITGSVQSVSIVTAPNWGTVSISGTTVTYTPAAGFTGQDSFTYTATNALGTSGPATVTVSVRAPVIVVSPTTLPSGRVGTVYSQTLTASGNALPPYFFDTTVASGTLPPGLALSSSGVVSGTPTTAGEYIFTVSGKDSLDTSFTSSPITLNVVEGNSLPGGVLMLLLGSD